MKLKTVLCDKLLHLAAIFLLAAQLIPNIARAQAQPAPPISGVLGKVQSFTDSSLDVTTPAGLVHVTVTQPLATYKQIPSDLIHVASNSYVGVASTQQTDGTELAKQVIIFPNELRALLALGGLELDRRCGDFTGRPLADDDSLEIVFARKSRSRQR